MTRWKSAAAVLVLVLAGTLLFFFGPKPEAPPAPTSGPLAVQGVAPDTNFSPVTGVEAAPAAVANSTNAPTPAPVVSLLSTNVIVATPTNAVVVPAPVATNVLSPTLPAIVPVPQVPVPVPRATPVPPPAPAVAATAPAPAPAQPSGSWAFFPQVKASELNVLAPAGHFPDWLREHVTKQAKHALVRIETYASLEEARQKMNARRYDVVAVSYRLVPELVEQKKLARLSATTNFPRPDPQFTSHFFDPENQYTLPYACSLYAIASKAPAGAVGMQTWAQFVANRSRAQLPADDGLTATLDRFARHSGAVAVEAKAKPSKEKVRRAEAVNPSSAKSSWQDSDASVRVDTLDHLRKSLPYDAGWRIVLPTEGSAIELYCLCVGAGTANPPAAAAFLAAVANPENAARLAQENQWTAVSKAAVAKLPEVVRQDPSLYPPKSVMDRCVFVKGR